MKLNEVLIIGACVVIATVLGVRVNPIAAWTIVTCLLCGAMLLGHPFACVFLYWGWSCTVKLIQLYTNSGVVRWTDEGFVVLLTALAGAYWIFQRRRLEDFSACGRLVAGLFALTLMSSLFNRISIIYSVHFYAGYLSFFVIFYLARLFVRTEHYPLLLKGWIAFIVLQLVLNFLWMAGVNPIRNVRHLIDASTGTFNAANVVAYFCVATVAMAMSFLIQEGRKKKKPLVLIFVLLLIIQIYFTYTVHSFYFLVFALISVVALNSRAKNSVMPVLGVALLGIMFISFFNFFEGTQGIELSGSISGQTVARRWNDLFSGQKATVLRTITDASNPFQTLIGFGPGNGTSQVAVTYVTPNAVRLLGSYYLTFSGALEQQGGSITQNPLSGLASIYSELGAAGVILFFFIHLYALWRVAVFLRKRRYGNIYQYILANGFIVLMLEYLIVGFLTDQFAEDYFVSTLWILAAAVWVPASPDSVRNLLLKKQKR
jgi:hypothetical protein